MKNIISLLGVAAMITGCAITETPTLHQESLQKPRFDVRHQEDRVTLLFGTHEAGLSAEHRSKVQRFIKYYKSMSPLETDFIISVIDYPDVESSKVPVYNQHRQESLMGIKEILHKQGIKYNVIKEMDLYPNHAYVEAAARRAILATAEEDEDLSGLMPDMEKLERPYKLALLVRKYDIRANECVRPGAIDRGLPMNSSGTPGTGIHTGCSVNSGLLSQIKDKTHVVYGDKTEPTFASEYEVKRLNDFYKGEYSGESNQTENVQANF